MRDRRGHFSSQACISLGVDVRLPTETLNFLLQNNEPINLISTLYNKPVCPAFLKAFSISKNTVAIDILLQS